MIIWLTNHCSVALQPHSLNLQRYKTVGLFSHELRGVLILLKIFLAIETSRGRWNVNLQLVSRHKDVFKHPPAQLTKPLRPYETIQDTNHFTIWSSSEGERKQTPEVPGIGCEGWKKSAAKNKSRHSKLKSIIMPLQENCKGRQDDSLQSCAVHCARCVICGHRLKGSSRMIQITCLERLPATFESLIPLVWPLYLISTF